MTNTQRMTVRRLARREEGTCRDMYRAAGRDGEWAGAMTPDTFAAAGEWWGLFCDGAPVLCAALADADRSVLQIRAMCGAQRTLGLPPAGRCWPRTSRRAFTCGPCGRWPRCARTTFFCAGACKPAANAV